MERGLPFVVASWRLPPTVARDDVGLLGGKAVGMLRLPPEWVPPFVILTRRFWDLLQESKAKDTFNLLPPDEFEIFRDFLISLSNLRRRVLVRSNAPTEGIIETVGIYLSEVAIADIVNVAESIDRVCNSGIPNPVYALLQECLEPALVGHMSNERRVSSERSLWLVEGLIQRGPTKIRAHDHHATADLSAANEKGLVRALRKVAGKLCTLEEGYFHCEWAWTTRRVWMVQADVRPHTVAHHEANKYLGSHTDSIPPQFMPGNLHLRHFLDVSNDRWKKLRRPRKFHELGLPHADVYLLDGGDWHKAKSEKFLSLLPDLEKMCVEPVIVRCDIADDVKAEDIFLPTSSPTKDPEKLIAFMEEIAGYFCKKGIEEKNWAFLLARVVHARASAMVHARPEARLVQIDALWGYPDGLLYYPHDTYYYHCDDGKVTERRRYKALCLLCTADAWETRYVNAPFDWGQVLSAAEVEVLAKWALRLANSLNHQIQLMALARISGHRGQEGCLPWHYMELGIIPPGAVWPQIAIKLAPTYVIRSKSDLMNLHNMVDPTKKLKGLVIRPDLDVLRDAEFLREVAEYSFKINLPIYFEGSLLGHAYYEMAKTGARVIPLSEAPPPVKITRYDKIVRDLVPAIIQRAGGVARIRPLPLDEAITLLTQKLVEESYEAWQCDRQHLGEELADILEVVDALRYHSGLSKEELDRILETKRARRGGFQKLILLEETSNQALEMVGTNSGIIPLFLENGLVASERRRHKLKEPADKLLATEWVGGEKELFKVEIPLVPPVKQGRRLEKLACRTGDYDIQVAYRGGKLSVTIGLAVKEPPAEQLLLFPDMQ